jgi:hypothetical protein
MDIRLVGDSWLEFCLILQMRRISRDEPYNVALVITWVRRTLITIAAFDSCGDERSHEELLNALQSQFPQCLLAFTFPLRHAASKYKAYCYMSVIFHQNLILSSKLSFRKCIYRCFRTMVMVRGGSGNLSQGAYHIFRFKKSPIKCLKKCFPKSNISAAENSNKGLTYNFCPNIHERV